MLNKKIKVLVLSLSLGMFSIVNAQLPSNPKNINSNNNTLAFKTGENFVLSNKTCSPKTDDLLPPGEVIWLACFVACKAAGHPTSFCVASCTYIFGYSSLENSKSEKNMKIQKNISSERLQNIKISVLLLEASMFGHNQTIKDMMEMGADINVKVSDIYVKEEGLFDDNYVFARIEPEFTPLLIAIKYKADVSSIKLLLQNGADANVKTEKGQTALDLAIEKGNPDVIELLREVVSK